MSFPLPASRKKNILPTTGDKGSSRQSNIFSRQHPQQPIVKTRQTPGCVISKLFHFYPFSKKLSWATPHNPPQPHGHDPCLAQYVMMKEGKRKAGGIRYEARSRSSFQDSLLLPLTPSGTSDWLWRWIMTGSHWLSLFRHHNGPIKVNLRSFPALTSKTHFRQDSAFSEINQRDKDI